MYSKKRKISILLGFVVLSLCFAGCGNRSNMDDEESITTLVMATFDNSTYLREQVDAFNLEHDDCKIEVREYERSEEIEKDGILKLQREIVSGKGPDIIDYGSEYTTSDIVGEYTEDLFPYITKEQSEKYFDNVLNAFSYNDGLYAVPLGFTMQGFVGTKQNLGNRKAWTIHEMMECYNAQKNERILYPGETKTDVLGTILMGNIEYYIDWESGECDFSGKEFQEVLEFCNGFPDHLEISEDYSVKQTFAENKALLLPIRLRSFYDICRAELIFGDQEVCFIGFPVEGTCGTVLHSCGPVLAINRNSAHKDMAWMFIEKCLGESGQKELPSGFPVNCSVFEEEIEDAMQTEYTTDENGESKEVVKQQVLFEGEEAIDIFCITHKQAEQLKNLVEETNISSTTDRKIYNIFWDEVAFYFEGSKGLEETVNIIQSRIAMYVNEKISYSQ